MMLVGVETMALMIKETMMYRDGATQHYHQVHQHHSWEVRQVVVQVDVGVDDV